MSEIERIVRDVPPEQRQIVKQILESEGFVVEVREQNDGLFTIVAHPDYKPPRDNS